MAFSIGNTAFNQSWAAASSATATISLSAGSVLLVTAHQNHTSLSLTISSVTSTNLTFTKRSAVAQTDSGTDTLHQEMEVWWANVPGALTSEVITVTSSGTPTHGSIYLTECKGLGNPSSPWDANSSLPATNKATATSNYTVSGVSTNSPAPVVWFIAGMTTVPNQPTPSGFTLQMNTANTASEIRGSYEVFAAQQTNQTYSGTSTGSAEWMVIADAFFGVGVPVTGLPPFDLRAH